MKKALIIGLAMTASAAAATPLAAQENTSEAVRAAFEVDAGKAKLGAKVFGAKACMGCHTVGRGRLAGPDLAGLLERRSEEWTRRWLKDPAAMLENDETAKALLTEYSNVRMPDMRLTDDEIDQLLHYIVETGKNLKKK